MAKAKCTVEFIGGSSKPTAILYDRKGHSINVMNFPRDTHLSSKAKAWARRILMKGCAEFSRGLGKRRR